MDKNYMYGRKFGLGVLIVICVSCIWLAYNIYVSQMVIIHDAVVFEKLGRFINSSGWSGYLVSTNREPFYPWLVSVSMRVASHFSLSYQDVQKIFQALFILLTQLLMLKILTMMKVKRAIILGCLIYTAFSPAILNTALSLWSEVVTYPFILGIVLFSALSFREIGGPENKKDLRLILYAVMAAVSFICIILTKAIFEYILYVYLVAAVFVLVLYASKNSRTRRRKVLIFLCVFSFLSLGAVNAYKLLNKKNNGNYALTYRGNWVLYGNILRRTQPLHFRQILSAITCIPGNQFMLSLAGKDDCEFWSQETVDTISIKELNRLSQAGLSAEDIKKKLSTVYRNALFRNPLQYMFLSAVEMGQMFFCESVNVGFVIYPKWVEAVYNTKIFYIPLTIGAAFLAVAAFAYFMIYLWRNKGRLLLSSTEATHNEPLFFIFVILAPYIVFHSQFTVITRYILPVAPLYIILIAFFLDRIFTT